LYQQPEAMQQFIKNIDERLNGKKSEIEKLDEEMNRICETPQKSNRTPM
jgi:flagellar biosynthesis chaperone FliJ